MCRFRSLSEQLSNSMVRLFVTGFPIFGLNGHADLTLRSQARGGSLSLFSGV